MDLRQFANQIDAMTCILSVEKKGDGSCGEIWLVTGNRAYIESIENPSPDVPHMMSTRFEPGSLYERYFPKDLNFELSTYFIASEIANHMLLTRLRELSRTDVLTGIMNRNEMNNRIDELREGKARIDRLGIVFADLNGLKRVNDQFGHVEGDRMPKESSAVLRQVFAGDEWQEVMAWRGWTWI